jgi:LCP family protein required for cell wall assembly
VAQRRGFVIAGRVVVVLVAAVVMGFTGFGWATYHHVVSGITISQVLGIGPRPTEGAQNILIMGLDSRLDQHGQPLPQDVYDALHAGDESSGGYNANVLILVHIPDGNGPVSAVSLPRDDYVELAGCPTTGCKGKVKQAYGLAYEQTLEKIASGTTDSATTTTDLTNREQTAREAGRKAEIETVRNLLGVPIDHFVEITLGGFFQVAKVIEPITVCLNEDTSDPYSGADFHQGQQQIDAAQAMAFVRQRRDENDGSFTDLDRTRRQQAFLVSLITKLRHDGVLSDADQLDSLLQVAKDNVAVDAGLALAAFAARATSLQNAPVSLFTLPITDFGQDDNGSSVNIVDVSAIRRIVHDRFSSDTPAAPADDPTPTPVVLNVVNATSRDGLAATLEGALATGRFTRGTASTADNPAETSSIGYGQGAQDAAQTLADQLHIPATADDTVSAGAVQLTVGAQFPAGDYVNAKPSQPGSSDATVNAVSATGVGAQAPAPTDLSQMTAAGTACVK